MTANEQALWVLCLLREQIRAGAFRPSITESVTGNIFAPKWRITRLWFRRAWDALNAAGYYNARTVRGSLLRTSRAIRALAEGAR